MKSNIVEIKNLTKRISNNIILNNVNLTLEFGKIYGIIGRNGSGKSMLLKSISGLLIPNEGSINVFDEEISKGNLPKNIGVLFDNVGLLDQYSAIDNLKILASINNKIGEKEIKKTLELLGLDPNDSKPVKKYSLGMKQKLGLTQALMEDPKLILLDEPMNGLDEVSVNLLRELLLELKKQNKTIIITSHNSDDIEILCDEVYKMDLGVLTKHK